MKKKINIKLILALLFFNPIIGAVAQDEQPHCHVYIDRHGWSAGKVDQLVKVRYDKADLCEGILSGYVCFSYFESREGCTKSDQSLVELFKKDARESGELVD